DLTVPQIVGILLVLAGIVLAQTARFTRPEPVAPVVT
ncbi:MAG: hypothetical protein QOK30_3525, partial [Nocardioidaceae bacterium]|nr:hypothetical protein [Nocardioidaceae bacterium]